MEFSPSSSARMTWLDDRFDSDRGELPFRRDRSLTLLRNGLANQAYELLLGAVACVDASEKPYRECLLAMQQVCSESGRSRAHACIDWYLCESNGEPTHPIDAANALISRGHFAEASRLFAREGLRAHEAIAHDRAGDRDCARTSWTRVAEDLRSHVGDDARVRRAIAVFCAARNSSDGPPRVRAVQAAMNVVRDTLPAFDAQNDRARVVDGLGLLGSMARYEGVPHEVIAGLGRFPEITDEPTIDPWVDDLVAADHQHDVVELSGRLLAEPPERFEGVSGRTRDFIRRRLLLARLLAVEIGRPSREKTDDARLRRNLALRLGQLGDRRFRTPLERMLADDDATVRRQAESALDELGVRMPLRVAS